MKKKNKSVVLLCLSLIFILISGIGASSIQTQGGDVTFIKDIKLPMPNGEYLFADIYKPKTATNDNPAPAVITSHGYFDNKEMQDMTGVELARRGFVVFSMDMYHHGASSGTHETYLYNREYYALGMLDLVDYVHDNINYIDNSKIGITGHSTGGRIVSYALDAYGRNAKIKAGVNEGAHYKDEPDDAGVYENKISSALIVANFPEPYLLENIPEDINVGISLGYYDEGAPMQLTKIDNHFWGDLAISPESKNFVNLTQPDTFQLEKDIDYDTETGKPDVELSNWDNNEKVEMGSFYGDVNTGDARVLYNPNEIHPWNTFSATSSEIMTDFFSETLGAPNSISGSNQVWFFKALFNALGLIGFFMFIIPFGSILLKTPFFKSLINPEPEKLPALRTGKRKLTFGMNIILGAAIPAATLMPFMSLNKLFFPDETTQNTTAWFSQPSTNQIMIWMFLNGLIALALFIVNYVTMGRKEGVTSRNWGLGIKVSNLVKTLLLSVVIVTTSLALVFLTNYFFKTDFRFWTVAIKAFDSSKVIVMLKYLPFFLVFFFVNSLIINGLIRVDGQRKWINMLFAILLNVGGLVVIISIQYGTLFLTGEAVWHPDLTWINILLAIPIVVGLLVATIISRKFFEKTGRIYLASFVNSILLAMMIVANTTTIMTL